ncbi:MAG: hypothetical protein K2N51_16055 [Lachnospiraceae bacterium]|nr:hypothetical protein [Lachnospiraceae bacterium]
MERSKAILLAGIIIGLIWLGMCVVLEGKKRKYVIIAGCIMDLVLFLICKNGRMLFYGMLGGLLCGLVPGLGGSLRKYNIAIKELNGMGNFVIVMIIFFIMMLMTMTIAHPELSR